MMCDGKVPLKTKRKSFRVCRATSDDVRVLNEKKEIKTRVAETRKLYTAGLDRIGSGTGEV